MESENNAEYRGIYNYLNGKMRNILTQILQ